MRFSSTDCRHSSLPDGSLARMDEGSSVIYKIVKINNAPLSILNDFVKPSKKEKKEKFCSVQVRFINTVFTLLGPRPVPSAPRQP